MKYEPSTMNRLLKKSNIVLVKSVEEAEAEAEAECNTFQPNLRKLKSPYLRNQIEFRHAVKSILFFRGRSIYIRNFKTVDRMVVVKIDRELWHFGGLDVSCNIVQLRFAVVWYLGRRPLSWSHDSKVNPCNETCSLH